MMRRMIVVALFLVASLAVVAMAAEEMYTLKGPVVSVDPGAKTVTVKSVEGVTTAADNRWKGEVKFATDEKTQITMGKGKKTLNDIKAGQQVTVKFHEKDGKSVADQIVIASGEKAK